MPAAGEERAEQEERAAQLGGRQAERSQHAELAALARDQERERRHQRLRRHQHDEEDTDEHQRLLQPQREEERAVEVAVGDHVGAGRKLGAQTLGHRRHCARSASSTSNRRSLSHSSAAGGVERQHDARLVLLRAPGVRTPTAPGSCGCAESAARTASGSDAATPRARVESLSRPKPKASDVGEDDALDRDPGGAREPLRHPLLDAVELAGLEPSFVHQPTVAGQDDLRRLDLGLRFDRRGAPRRRRRRGRARPGAGGCAP